MSEPNYSRKMVEQVSKQLGQLYATIEQGNKADNAVPKSTQINGKTLSGDINLNATDVGARNNTWLPTCAEINAEPIPASAVENNFVSFDANRKVKDSGKNANSFLPNIYTAADANEILVVGNNGAVTSVPSVPASLETYNVSKSYIVNEAFFYGSGENEGIYVTTVPHGSESFNPDHNHLIARTGVVPSYVKFTLSNPSASSAFVLSGTLQQQIQGLLSNIKDLQNRVATLEAVAVRTDTPGVKVNVTSTPSTAQAGWKIIRIDPNDVV